MRSNPHIIEINVRPWLKQLREKYYLPLTLLTVPDEEWFELKHLGFDAVWLMGVWTPSPKAEEIARETPALKEFIEKTAVGASISDITASPYAIFDYKLNPDLGSHEELALLREKLNSIGLHLVLDFVSNHLALDHPLISSCPDCFILADPEEAQFHQDWFYDTPVGSSRIAYGRDPNFPPWRDTAQLNYFNPSTRDFMRDTLLKLADICDGVRCDMAMLTLNEVHDGTWGWLLRKKGFVRPDKEFWPDAIQAVKDKNPHFTFLAEVYWGLEWRIQEMGFDYTYDKVLYDRLRYLGPAEVKGHLRAEKLYQKRSVRFIENHDETPAVAAFGHDKSLAAAAITSTLRGMRLFHHGQLNGVAVKSPIQYSRYDFPTDPHIRKIYEKILRITDHPAFHGGEWTLIDAFAAAYGEESFNNLLCWSWAQRRTHKLIVVNYSAQHSKGRIPITAPPKNNAYTFYDECADRFFTCPADEIRSDGLYVELPPYGMHILDLEF